MSTADVSQDRMRALLAEQAESATLEFIADCDLAVRHDVVELATEVGAMAARGGSLVIGADDHGNPTGRLDDRKASLFDEATVRDKLSRYLPATLDLRVGRHRLGAWWAVLISIGAHPDGAVVFVGDGTYDEKGSSRTAFRKGEFFVRHGTKSERPSQDDVREIGRAAVEKARLWLDELHRIQEAVMEIGEVAREEMGRAPGGRTGVYGARTRLPAARRQLAGRIAALEAAGGPQLPQCRDLAESSVFTAYIQYGPAVFSATDEIARAFEQRRPPA